MFKISIASVHVHQEDSRIQQTL